MEKIANSIPSVRPLVDNDSRHLIESSYFGCNFRPVNEVCNRNVVCGRALIQLQLGRTF